MKLNDRVYIINPLNKKYYKEIGIIKMIDSISYFDKIYYYIAFDNDDYLHGEEYINYRLKNIILSKPKYIPIEENDLKLL